MTILQASYRRQGSRPRTLPWVRPGKADGGASMRNEGVGTVSIPVPQRMRASGSETPDCLLESLSTEVLLYISTFRQQAIAERHEYRLQC